MNYNRIQFVTLFAFPAGFPTIAIIPDGKPGSWWTDEIKSFDGTTIFKQPGLKIYKARWFLFNTFSYYQSKYERLEK